MPDSVGKIPYCLHQDCGFACCDFAADNFIVLYPGELEKAVLAGKSVEHLDYSPDGQGGYRAICQAKNTATCDNGYKPLDCACYPLFPTVDENGHLRAGLKGGKCPLQLRHLGDHQRWVLRRWQELVDSIPQLTEWIRQTKLVGYLRWKNDP